MEVFNKLKNTLTSTVNEIAHALPGNPLLREYDATEQVASAGPDYIWKIYNGTKKSTKAAVSIFVLEKRQLDQYPRNSRELILEVARKGVVQLTKLRHPRILTVEHAVEESRDSLVFCTEPVFASLGNVLGTKKNIADIPTPLRSYHLYDVEIKYGILQISEGLSFLHESAKMLHGNLSPESIIINKQGVWKLSGFDFCLLNTNQSGEAKFSCRDWDTSLSPPAQPNPCYLAPEIILEKRCDFSSDLFSLGALLYSIYYTGKPLLECNHTDVYRVMSRKVDNLRNLSTYDLDKFPKEVIDHEKMLIHPDSRVRPDADQIGKLPYFEDIGVVTLQYLDNILQRDNLQKSQFFKGLAQVLPAIPKRVTIQRILPSLCAEFSNKDMLPFVLPHIMTIAEDCDDNEYKTHIFPALIPVFKVQSPVQVLLILLQKMDLLLKKTPKASVQAHILPMIGNALAAPSIQIQELCLSIIPTFAELLDVPSMKNSILPKIKKIIWEGGTASVRINGLVCIGKLLPMLDKWFIYDEIFPILFQMKSREPGILMAMLGIFQTTFNHKKLGISKDILATKVVPFLVPFTVEVNLNIQQFNTFMKVIKEMLQRVENDQRSKLEQLGQVKVDESTKNFKKLTTANNAQITNGLKNEVADVFGSGKTSSPQVAEAPSITRQHLTLEEKQRLAKANEMEYRMKKQGDLKPQQLHKAGVPKKTEPKDLTSTLMSSNLNMMNTSGRRNPSTLVSQSTALNSSVTAGRTPSYNTTMSQKPVNPVKPNYMLSSSSQPSLTSYGGGFSSPMPVSQNWGGSNTGQQRSSLDNLLTMSSQTKTAPLNTMQNTTGTPQYNMQAMSMSQQQGNQTAAMPAAQNSRSAFDRANPFIIPAQGIKNQSNSFTTPTPGIASQTKPSGNLSQQDLLDFLG